MQTKPEVAPLLRCWAVASPNDYYFFIAIIHCDLRWIISSKYIAGGMRAQLKNKAIIWMRFSLNSCAHSSQSRFLSPFKAQYKAVWSLAVRYGAVTDRRDEDKIWDRRQIWAPRERGYCRRAVWLLKLTGKLMIKCYKLSASLCHPLLSPALSWAVCCVPGLAGLIGRACVRQSRRKRGYCFLLCASWHRATFARHLPLIILLLPKH